MQRAAEVERRFAGQRHELQVLRHAARRPGMIALRRCEARTPERAVRSAVPRCARRGEAG
jgi:hypothetical protein